MLQVPQILRIELHLQSKVTQTDLISFFTRSQFNFFRQHLSGTQSFTVTAISCKQLWFLSFEFDLNPSQ